MDTGSPDRVDRQPHRGLGQGSSSFALRDARQGTWEALAPNDGTARRLLSWMLEPSGPAGDAEALADRLLEAHGSLSGVLAALRFGRDTVAAVSDAARDNLMRFAESLQHVMHEQIEENVKLGSVARIVEYVRHELRHERVEMLRILFLDKQNGLISDRLIAQGTIDHCPLYPREIVRLVIELGASSLVLIHNHPSGDPTPSVADVETTRRLKLALATVECSLLDHIVIGRNSATSMRQLGMI
jgi:DNA repair protein RadC